MKELKIKNYIYLKMKEGLIDFKIDIASGKIYASCTNYSNSFPIKPQNAPYRITSLDEENDSDLEDLFSRRISTDYLLGMKLDDEYVLVAEFKGKKDTKYVKDLLKEINKNVDEMTYEELQEAISTISNIMNKTSMGYCLTAENEEGKISVEDYENFIKQNITYYLSLLRILQNRYDVVVEGFNVRYNDLEDSIDAIMRYVSDEIEILMKDPKNYQQGRSKLSFHEQIPGLRPKLFIEDDKRHIEEPGYQKVNK